MDQSLKKLFRYLVFYFLKRCDEYGKPETIRVPFNTVETEVLFV